MLRVDTRDTINEVDLVVYCGVRGNIGKGSHLTVGPPLVGVNYCSCSYMPLYNGEECTLYTIVLVLLIYSPRFIITCFLIL